MTADDRMQEAGTSELEGLATLLVELSRAIGVPVERHAALRLLAEARSAWPGEYRDQWWKWTIEAGLSLGLPVRATDLSLMGAIDLAGSRNPVATILGEEDADWLVMSAGQGSRLTMISGAMGGSPRTWHAEQVPGAIGKLSHTLPARWVVAQQDHLLAPSAGHAHHMSPYRRLLKLLQPEWSDIWVVIVLALFIGALATAVPIAAQQLVRTVTFGTLYQPIFILSVVLFGFLVFMASLQALTIFVAELVQRRLFARVVADLSYRLPRAEYTALDSHYMPEFVNRFFDTITVQKVVGAFLVDGVALILTTMVGMALLAFYHPFLLGYDIVLLLLMVLTIVVVGRGGVKTAIQESIAKYRTAAWLEEISRCAVSFKLYGAADFSVDRADRLTAEYLSARQKHFRIMLRQFLCILGLQSMASTVLLGLGGYLVIQEQLTLGQLVAAELVVTNIVGSFAKLTKHIESYYDLMAAVDKLGHLFDIPIESQRGLMILPQTAAAEVEVRDLTICAPAVAHDHGTTHATHPLFEGLSFHLRPSEALAISGPPGSGKSLLLDCLLRLRHHTHGVVLMDGVEPADLRPEVLRHQVALVRDVELVEGTVADNVHFQRPEVETADVRRAIELVGLDTEIQILPRGLTTTLSTTGRPLSDSQTRRLMLARALAGHPRLILIDGLLDTLSDEMMDAVWQNLRNLPHSPTLVVVTGRERLRRMCEQHLDLGRNFRHGTSHASSNGRLSALQDGSH